MSNNNTKRKKKKDKKLKDIMIRDRNTLDNTIRKIQNVCSNNKVHRRTYEKQLLGIQKQLLPAPITYKFHLVIQEWFP